MRSTVARARGGNVLWLIALLGLSGCTLIPPPTPSTTETPIEIPRLPPKIALPPVEEPPAPLAKPAPDRAPEAAPEPAPEPPRVAVLLTQRIADYESVADALRDALGDIDVYDLSDKSLTPKETVDAIREADTEVVVAIGYRAAAFASGIEDTPVVFSQVFNTENLDLDSARIKGVSMLPPLDKQLAAWKELNPNLSSVGAIIGPGHEGLLEEARIASDGQGVRFESRLARSDRETLYLFTRLVPQIDGYWLFPDNRILSPAVLRQMVSYAARHRVQIAVFNDSLLSIGATLSTTGVDDDIARTILNVASRMLADEGASLPSVTPLSDIAVSPSGAQVRSTLSAGPNEPPEGSR